MNVLIIEDEALGAEGLADMLRNINPSISVVGITDSIRSSVDWLSTHPAPDLIFMDIELADGQSFEILREVEILSPIIFTTSYDEYALKAFKVNSIDYLLKPITEEELRNSLNKVHNLKQQLLGKEDRYKNIEVPVNRTASQISRHKEERDRFLIKQGQRFFSVETSDIAYFFTKGKISFIKAKNGKEYFLNYTLDELEPMLSSKTFYRINRQVIASHSSIEQVQTWFNGKLKVSLSPPMEDDETIVSREKAKDFRQWMGE